MRPLLALMLCALAFAGCKSEEELRAIEQAASEPLAFDPTERNPLATWWSNGEQLVRLDEVHSYAIYGDTNRYRAPIEVGRWRQQNYATLWFEPYDRVERAPLRVEISKLEGRLALAVPACGSRPAMEGLLGQAAPPAVVEDRLVGEWNGDAGRLVLLASGRYRFSPPPARVSGADARPPLVRLAGHDGAWLVEADQLLLHPDSPGMAPVAMTLSVIEEDTVKLSGAQGELTQGTSVVGAPNS